MNNISVIILCCNNSGIDICINSVKKQLINDDEIIVINDHSDNEFLESFVIPYVDNNIKLISVDGVRGNRAHNRNLGVSYSKHDIIFFIDGDMIVHDGALIALRDAHQKSDYVGFLGNAHALRFAQEHLELYLGTDDYINLITNTEGRNKLILNELIQDWRISDLTRSLSQPELEKYNWIYYYTCVCSVRKDIFNQVGGFDENIITWGSEDIDLGYKISKYGKIGYLAKMHAFHIPHKRNLWNETSYDKDNIRYLLDKFKDYHFELMIAFDMNYNLISVMNEIRDDLLTWNLDFITPESAANTIFINALSYNHVNETVIWYNSAKKQIKTGLIGIALPCSDLQFEKLYISSAIFCYPQVIIARILQESIRVSEHVYIVQLGNKRPRKCWNTSPFYVISDVMRASYTSCDIMEYNFITTDHNFIEVSSPHIRNKLLNSGTKCPVFVTYNAREKWHKSRHSTRRDIFLIILTDLDTDLTKKKIENSLGISFAACYNFLLEKSDEIKLSNNIPLALAENNAQLFFVLSDVNIIKEDLVWYNFRSKANDDIFLDLNGEFMYLNEIINLR